jgi:starch synthase
MRILFAASEAAPFAKTGGLADVMGGLPSAVASLGHEVSLVLPRYRQVDVHGLGLKRAASFTVPLGSWKERCDAFKGRMGKNVTVYFIDKGVYFDRPELYGTAHGDYPDNAERFIFFSRAVLELCRALDLRPDIVHCNDWQTGLTPLYLKRLYADTEGLRGARTVFTVHNLGYQGLFQHRDMRLTGLDWDVFTPDGIEFWGRMNLLKAGLVSSDIITTVSKTYSREIQMPEYGCGLDGVLKSRSADLFGIVNGIDYASYDPARDRALSKKYSAVRPAGREACRKALHELLGFPYSAAPLIGMVTRLADQKGLDLLTEALPDILSLGARLAILGSGDERYRQALSDAAAGRPESVRVLLRYDDVVARRIYAGCDIFLMPSRYEPCGLGQMIAQRYGAVPVVRKTGGLADTVTDYNARNGRGAGFTFEEYSVDALVACLRRAVETRQDERKWKRLSLSGMNRDFSWERSAKEYVKAYRRALRKTT